MFLGALHTVLIHSSCVTFAVIWFTREKEYQDQRPQVSNFFLILIRSLSSL